MVKLSEEKDKKGSVKKGQRLQPLSASSDHFNTTVSAQEIEQSSKGCIPANTSSSTAWAVHVFQAWLQQRNSCADVDEVYPTDLLDKVHPCDVICNCLQWFFFLKQGKWTEKSILPKHCISYFVDC